MGVIGLGLMVECMIESSLFAFLKMRFFFSMIVDGGNCIPSFPHLTSCLRRGRGRQCGWKHSPCPFCPKNDRGRTSHGGGADLLAGHEGWMHGLFGTPALECSFVICISFAFSWFVLSSLAELRWRRSVRYTMMDILRGIRL